MVTSHGGFDELNVDKGQALLFANVMNSLDED